jgi:hypothetical protein
MTRIVLYPFSLFGLLNRQGVSRASAPARGEGRRASCSFPRRRAPRKRTVCRKSVAAHDTFGSKSIPSALSAQPTCDNRLKTIAKIVMSAKTCAIHTASIPPEHERRVPSITA